MISIVQNVGKIFEQDFKNSTPDNVFYYRIPDPPQSFGGQSNLRFSRKNPCDCFLLSPISRTFYALELKSVSGENGISFERNKDEKGIIHFHQIEGLNKFNTYEGIVAGFVINLRKQQRTYFIQICDFLNMIDKLNKKSFNETDLLKYNPTLINQYKKRTRYTYDIDKFLNDTKLN